MVVEYESISFVSFISNETRYFKLGECDNIFSYLFNLFIFVKVKNSFFNLKRYILNIFENNYEWSDGIFKLSMLNNIIDIN